MDEASQELLEALVSTFRPYLAARLEERGWPRVPGAEEAAQDRLSASLSALLAKPPREQRQTPMELFREAVLMITGALVEAGAEPVPRDDAVADALPEDVLDLAPASPAELGEQAWRAHLAWGASKAAGMRPTALLLSGNLMDIDRIEGAVRRSGYRLVRLAGEPFPEGAVAFVDLERRDADSVIRTLASRGTRVVAFGPHVDDLATTRARSLGAEEALPRSRFFATIDGLLPPLV